MGAKRLPKHSVCERNFSKRDTYQQADNDSDDRGNEKLQDRVDFNGQQKRLGGDLS